MAGCVPRPDPPMGTRVSPDARPDRASPGASSSHTGRPREGCWGLYREHGGDETVSGKSGASRAALGSSCISSHFTHGDTEAQGKGPAQAPTAGRARARAWAWAPRSTAYLLGPESDATTDHPSTVILAPRVMWPLIWRGTVMDSRSHSCMGQDVRLSPGQYDTPLHRDPERVSLTPVAQLGGPRLIMVQPHIEHAQT